MSGWSTRRSARTAKVAASEKGKQRGARKRKRSPGDGEVENAEGFHVPEEDQAADPAPPAKRRKASTDKEEAEAPGGVHAAVVAPQARDYSKDRRPVVLNAVGGEAFRTPCSIGGTENGNIVCVDRAAIRTFTREGELLHKVPVEKKALPQIACLPGGRVVVALDHRLMIVEADGTERLISEWAPPDYSFHCPAIIPGSGNIVVMCTAGREHSLFVISQAGELLRTNRTPFVPFPFTTTTEGTIVVGSNESAVLHLFDADGNALGKVAPDVGPGVVWRRLAGDHSGNIIGATSSEHVVVIRKDGTELYRVGGKGRNKGSFRCLHSVGVLPDGTILASDCHAQHVKLL